jgi:hypothetical protein
MRDNRPGDGGSLRRQGMKKVVEKLETAKHAVLNCSHSTAVSCIEEAIEELKAPPRWYTPDQWEAETGEPWPDDWAVYALEKTSIFSDGYSERFRVMEYETAKWKDLDVIVVAAEAGPPPNGWRPEEENR